MKNKYDFIDFGASNGGSIAFVKRYLGGINGLGIDLNSQKVKKMQELGLSAIVGDFTKNRLPKKSVRFVVISHVLEHLPDLKTVELALKNAVSLSREFVYIQGPVFDFDEYLKSNNFKFYWSDWHGHTLHLTTAMLEQILSKLKYDFNLYFRKPVFTSLDTTIHPLKSPRDQSHYNKDIHPEKKELIFDKELYQEFVCIIKLEKFNSESLDKLFKYRKLNPLK